MKFLFEVNTTFEKPIYLYIDENQSVKDFIEEVVIHIETYTSYLRSDILDVFVQNTKDIMSIPNTDKKIKEFLLDNPEYFREWTGSLHRNIHKIYVMDNKYLKTLNNKNDIQKEPVTTGMHMLKTLLPTIYF